MKSFGQLKPMIVMIQRAKKKTYFISRRSYKSLEMT